MKVPFYMRFLLLFVGMYDVYAYYDCDKSDRTREMPPSLFVPEVTLCRQLNGYCYDDRCENCTEGVIRTDLCGDTTSEHKKCCVPENPLFGCCELFGDPHVRTFDGLEYQFQKEGKYKIVYPCEGNDFQINGFFKKTNPANWWTAIKDVEIIIGTKSVLIEKDFATGKLTVTLTINGVSQNVGFNYEDADFHIFSNDGGVTIYVKLKKLGVLVCFTTTRCTLSIYVRTRWFDKLCGLCGNWNYNIKDDLDNIPEGPDANEECPPPRDDPVWRECKARMAEVIKEEECTGVNVNRYLFAYVTDFCLGGEAAANLTLAALRIRCSGRTDGILDNIIANETPS